MAGVTFGHRGKPALMALLALIASLIGSAICDRADAHTSKRHHHKHTHHARRHVPAPSVTDLESSAKYAAFVGEPETGKILYERRPDAQRFPASLTKMMTLYQLFSALEQGRVKLTDNFHVSSHAANQAPSKLGLDSGDTIGVEDAIEAIVVVSANDVAVTVAENLGDDEDNFAKQMTSEARKLGMTNSQFVNASGLPDDDQLSTAHDMYTLARHLIYDFPQYFHYFGLETFRWNGRTYPNHNRLVGRVDGVDGMKTGYTLASGFHLVATAKREGHRLIAVVMGGQTSRQRDEAMRRLLNTQFAALTGSKVQIAKDEPSTNAAEDDPADRGPQSGPPAPRPKPGDELAVLKGGAPISEDEAENAGHPGEKGPVPTPAQKPSMTETASAAPAVAATPEPQPKPNALVEAVVPSAQASTPPAQNEELRWGIQIGAYLSAETASSKLSAARKFAPKLLAHTAQSVARVAVDDTAYYRARFAPLEQDDAQRACALLEPHGFKCFTIQEPESEINGPADRR